MKTYQKGLTRYWWDAALKSWTVQHLNKDGHQIGTVEYYANRKSLLENYPRFKFKMYQS